MSVVDGPEGDTAVEKALHKEAVKAILNGAAVFFPDKHVRRDKLFHMMVSRLKTKQSFHINKKRRCPMQTHVWVQVLTRAMSYLTFY